MPRVRVKRELCDCVDCRDPSSFFPNVNGVDGVGRYSGSQAATEAEAADAVSEAIAQQRPPPKALLIFLDGQLQSLPTGSAAGGTTLEACKHPNLDAVARDGATGWLAFRSGGSVGSSAGSSADAAGSLSQLAQLCGLSPQQATIGASSSEVSSIEKRYKGMRAVLLACGSGGGGSSSSSESAAVDVGRAAGFYRSLTMQQAAQELAPAAATTELAAAGSGGAAAAAEGLPPPSDTADIIVSLLGVQHVRVQTDAQQPGDSGAEANGGPAAAAAGNDGGGDGDDEDDVDLLLLHVSLHRGEGVSSSGSSVSTTANSHDGSDATGAARGAATTNEAAAAAAAAAEEAAEAEAAEAGHAAAAAVGDVRWADALVGELSARPGFRRGALLALLLGDAGRLPLPQPARSAAGGGRAVGALGAPAHSPAPPTLLQPLNAGLAPGGFPPVARPRQSYELHHEEGVDVAGRGFALVAQRLPAVIRTDDVRELSLGSIVQGGGLRCVLAERLLPEVAYKLGRAPKYGA